ncbi:MAG: hypothetical protein MPJ08_01355 [Nitrosopumilus sp.]|nr:hypothetical protein [Nitrosopumilus sp.]
MNQPFAFRMPPKARRLGRPEYVALVNRLRGNFISYVASLDAEITIIITDFFLRDKKDVPLWASTVLDDEKVSFGVKKVWFMKILSRDPRFGMDRATIRRIDARLSKIRSIRNDFAHNAAYNKQVSDEDVAGRMITLYDYEGGRLRRKRFGMQEIMDLIEDPLLPAQIRRAAAACKAIRDGAP